MAVVLHTELPKHTGERRFAERLQTLLDERAHLWFGVNYLPGVTDIDVLLWHDEIGLFTIEVKAVTLSMIESFGLTRCKIQGREEGRSPHAQAQEAELRLRQYLAPRKLKVFNIPTAAFPLITRDEWNSAWSGREQLTGNWPETIIFSDDLSSGREPLLERLNYIYKNPPSGAGSDRTFNGRTPANRANLALLSQLISPNQERPKPLESDLTKLRNLEASAYAEVKDKFPAFGNTVHAFLGHPGTGKTWRMLQVGYEHATSGAKVLFLCFNKVLAADIRRVLSGRDFIERQMGLALNDVPEMDVVLGDEAIQKFTLDVADVWEAMQSRLHEQGLEVRDDGVQGEDSFDSYGIEAVALLELARSEIAQYDTVLVDEAQDMREWQFRLARMHLKEKGTLLVAYGRGQELYRVDEKTVEQIGGLTSTRLRRNFRNTKESFRAAYVAHEAYLDEERIKQSAKRFVKDFLGNTDGLDFDRAEGRAPILEPVNMDLLDVEDRSSPFFAEQELELLVSQYKRILEEQLDALEERHRPIDLLLLVPTDKCVETRALRVALSELKHDFVDLTDETLRRSAVPQTAIRLCTYHSARGIEGYRVVLFGLRQLPSVCERIGLNRPENLLYVVLTRAIFETTIVVRSDEWNSDIVVFVQKVIEHLRSRAQQK